ncbi:hypothetical protein [Pseudoalteromonas sp. McH1-42]|uniref:hypothetical protein n=1 Tax=Pseudoalteromonas sp. McH1-42 TaxID=2917752 RepID=UPI001EF7441A|nr:hypothetical protein [Pseudoalteromonas sp. McH1-42]MCG7561288.1 hypothetical protein [Pseudoalteromonas sp. McH1-42]
MNISKYWSPFFWGTFFYAFFGQFIVVMVFQGYGQEGVDSYKAIETACLMITMLVMWSYAFIRAFKASTLTRRVVLFILSVVLLFASGYLFYIYDMANRKFRRKGNESGLSNQAK